MVLEMVLLRSAYSVASMYRGCSLRLLVSVQYKRGDDGRSAAIIFSSVSAVAWSSADRIAGVIRLGGLYKYLYFCCFGARDYRFVLSID